MIKAFRICGVLIILCSAAPLIPGYLLWKSTHRFLATAIRVEAEVIEIEKSSGNESYLYPVFQFADIHDEIHRIRSGWGSSHPSHSIGDRAWFYYDPDNPEKTKRDSFISLWLLPFLCAIAGALALAIGLAMLLLLPIVFRALLKPSDSSLVVPSGTSQPSEVQPIEPSRERTLSMVCHLSSLACLLGIPFGNIFGPLASWLINKDRSPLVDRHGRESLNFQLSMTIYVLISCILCLVLIGFVLLPVLAIADLVLIIRASVQASAGKDYRYPFTIRFISTPGAQVILDPTVENEKNAAGETA